MCKTSQASFLKNFFVLFCFKYSFVSEKMAGRGRRGCRKWKRGWTVKPCGFFRKSPKHSVNMGKCMEIKWSFYPSFPNYISQISSLNSHLFIYTGTGSVQQNPTFFTCKWRAADSCLSGCAVCNSHILIQTSNWPIFLVARCGKGKQQEMSCFWLNPLLICSVIHGMQQWQKRKAR